MTTLVARRVGWEDPATSPLREELTHEYVSRYGDAARAELTRYDPAVFSPPHGTLVLLFEGGAAVAGGAFMRHDRRTAELKRIWTHSRHRRRGLARRVLAELEREAVRFGYARLYLTTGPRQPEARALYLATGYTPLFDLTAEALPLLPFEKDLR
ncbi:GNAT family N-acetyltransferase [Saccharothrix luteola]|uniref:GNAT family N-acetyltransferase n=1 Tax=Saccharothrix luteola TaxID=2893018 RepID=UPI001E59578B|nr:GNAT family N-acetyltransferase [Saccharothrix luteola]MCC8248857.1 GNAT family N-acetyltransferase [Saccharothrix luteola]